MFTTRNHRLAPAPPCPGRFRPMGFTLSLVRAVLRRALFGLFFMPTLLLGQIIPPPGMLVTVTVSPASVTLATGATRQFSATVMGAKYNTAVTWSVQEQGGGTIGNGGNGPAAGFYTAPAGAGIYHVVATSQEDSTAFSTATVTVISPAPVISYSPNSLVLTVGTSMTGPSPTNTGGAAASWSIAPALPAGLSCNSGTGVITGIPSAASASASYTVTASNASGNGSTSLTITVNPAAPRISYSPASQSYTVGTAIGAWTPANTGGAATTWSISPALSAGLSLSTSTGQITGTPTAARATTSYTVTASNAGGSGTASITLTVIASLTPPVIAYSPSSKTYPVGVAIAAWTPSNTGGLATSWSIAPALPTGLSFSTSSGQITGTPSAACASAPYAVTATNAAGNGTTTVTVSIVTVLAISTYTADAYALPYGGNTTLHWTLAGTPTQLTLNGSDVFGTTGLLVNPVRRQVFTLTATDATGATASATVTVAARGLESLAGSAVAGSVNGIGNAAGFQPGGGLAFDPATGNVVVADAGNCNIRRIDYPTRTVTHLAGRGNAGMLDDTTSPGNAAFYNPKSLAYDGLGNIYVADTNNCSIRKISPAGLVSTFAGASSVFGYVDGTGSGARFNTPLGIATDGANNVYVADYSNCRIRKISPAGVVTTLAGSGAGSAVDGIGTGAAIGGPTGVVVDPSDNSVYVVQKDYHVVRRITQPGLVVTTLAGVAGQSGFSDGTGSAARFNQPNALAVDSKRGLLYISDTLNHRIRQLDLATGAVTTLTGDNPSQVILAGPFRDSGAQNPALLQEPYGIAVRADGDVVVYSKYQILALTNPASSPQAPGFTYSPTSQAFPVNAAISPWAPTRMGGVPHLWSITPALPAGLSFDPNSGRITGTPTATGASTAYTVTAINAMGAGTSTLTTAVTATLQAPVISYGAGPFTLTMGTAMAPLPPANAGGAAASWSISPALPAGLSLSASTGQISGTPTAISAATSYTVTATNAAGNGIATATFSVQGVAVAIAPGIATLAPGATQQFSATVTGTATTAVTWSVPEAGGGTVSAAGLYTAPATPGSYHLIATSVADPTRSATATITVQSVAVAITPGTATLAPGATQQFSATVTGTANTAVTWSIPEPGGGTVSAAGLYTAPATPGSYHLIATSVADPTRSSTAGVTVGTATAPTITGQPVSATVTDGASASFSVTATGTGPLTYQWRKGGVDLTGATGALLNFSPASPGDAGSYLVVVRNSAGSAASNLVTLTVNLVAPTITAQPLAQSVVAPNAATFTVTATGSTPLAYQWKKNNTDIPLATSASYTTPATSTADQGSQFAVAVTNAAGGALSLSVTLSVAPTPVAPSITTQPTAQTAAAGQAATFSVVATGVPGPTYQWKKNGIDIGGATGASHTTPATVAGDNGSSFAVVVSNSSGAVTSNTVLLTVTSPALGPLTWKRDIVYLGGKEVGEVDAAGIHVTLTDHLGSPRLLVDPGGAVTEQKYMPFGESLTDPATMAKTAKGFTNHEQTDPSGLIYMQARFYAPMYHRFLSPDPARDQHFEMTQSWNIYSYVRNSPLMNVDPTGMADDELGKLTELQIKSAQNTASQAAPSTAGTAKTPPAPAQTNGAAQTKGKTGTQAEMAAKHKDDKPVKATAKGKTVTYEYANGDKFTITGNHPNRDQNPGNVVASGFATDHDAVGKDGRFAIFPTAADGWSAMHDVIAETFGNLSVNDMIAKYAPPSENDTKGYQATATKLAGVSGDAKISSLTAQQVGTLMNVMAKRVEGWSGDPYVPK